MYILRNVLNGGIRFYVNSCDWYVNIIQLKMNRKQLTVTVAKFATKVPRFLFLTKIDTPLLLFILLHVIVFC